MVLSDRCLYDGLWLLDTAAVNPHTTVRITTPMRVTPHLRVVTFVLKLHLY